MIDIVEYWNEVKSKWKSVLVVVLSCFLIGTVYSTFLVKQDYESTVKVFIGKQKFQNTSENYNSEEVALYQRLITTYSEIIKSKKLINKSINESKINSLKGIDHTKAIKYGDVIGNFTVTPIANTQIIELKYRSNNAQLSYDLLYSIAENLIAYSKELYPTVNIKVLEQVNVVNGALMSKKLMISGISLILGLIIGIGGIVAMIYFDNTFKSKRALEEEFDIPVIGIIPNFEG